LVGLVSMPVPGTTRDARKPDGVVSQFPPMGEICQIPPHSGDARGFERTRSGYVEGMASVEKPRQVGDVPVRARTLDELYELHAPSLRRHCERLTRDPYAAEDLMQEVFVRFMARFPEVPADMNVAGYLFATARNVLWKQLRDDHEVADGDIEWSAGPDDDLEVDPERSALLGEQQSLVRRCSAMLTGRQRRALTLREVEGHSYAEIGSDLGIGTDAVAQVISRARVRLRVAVRRAHVDLDQLAPECRSMLAPLSDYLDGHAAKSSGEIEAHLAQCASCRRTLADFQGAGSRLRGTLPLAPVAGVLARIGEAVRLGGGGPADAVRAGAVVVAAALAIGGTGTYAAHELTAAPGARAAAHARTPVPDVRTTPSVLDRAPSGPAASAAPSAVQGRRAASGSKPATGARHPSVQRRPGVHPNVAAPAALRPGSAPVGTPTGPPASTPPVAPAVDDPTTTPPPANGGGVSPGRPPAVDPSDPAVPVTHTVAASTDRVGKRVVQPVASKVVAPVVDKVVRPVVGPVVSKVVAPVVTDVVAPVAKAIAPVTDPVAKAAAPVTTPVVAAVAPVVDPVVKAVAPVLPATTSPATSTPPPVPPASTPAVTTPAVTTPIVTIPSITVPRLG
jgi:RNA polymerase sigma factor (sigma-70 family)